MAVDMFLAVMRFMGDAPLKGQNELDVLCTLLKGQLSARLEAAVHRGCLLQLL